ncbi:unnamed protein product [Tuwongella immobilis]|uniref:Uncharacterized protein n=1 Tax=Tuwongella immobilis TaxID=692036 RepID=A0A6C2YP89_9BACT|nr:unnamed protein product [Tuwongella immobilis]VTS03648.1 unnamed protein product [Tuwongella immobilis]
MNFVVSNPDYCGIMLLQNSPSRIRTYDQPINSRLLYR